MGFLKRFFRNVFRDESLAEGYNSFEQVPKVELESHLAVAQYGKFVLTDAIRPSFDLKIVPEQGFRHDHYRDPSNHTTVPVLMAAVSRESLFETFLDLLDPLGSIVDVVLETSHKQGRRGHEDLYREHIDLPVLKSHLYSFEELLMNDGCTGIAVLNPSIPVEIQFDEHKLLIVYGEDVRPFERIFAEKNIQLNEQVRFLTEAEHVHSSKGEYIELFSSLQTTLGMDDGFH